MSLIIENEPPIVVTVQSQIARVIEIKSIGSQGPAGGFRESYETLSKNLRQFPYAITYNLAGLIDEVTYTTIDGPIVKKFNYTSGNLTSVVFSGAVPSGINTTKTFSYDLSGKITGAIYS
jgi:hypothetical protein